MRPTTLRVLVADDQPIVREGFDLLLGAVDGFLVAGCASTSGELLEQVATRSPDVVLLDLRLGGEEGLVAAKHIKFRYPDVAVLLFPTFIADEQVERALALGVDGIVLKTAPVPEVLDAIATVARGEIALGNDVGVPSESSRLSAREREILRLMSEGLSNREISQTLFISVATTKTHLENIARKLGTSHRAAAVAEAIRRGLVA